MIEIINGSLFDSDAGLIVHSVNCRGVMGAGIAKQVADYYPHVEREYRKYLKKTENPLGTVQYVPIDVWALMMVDTMKNNNIIPYDNKYQYIANLFGQQDIGSGVQTDLKAFKHALEDIKKKAESLGTSVAMPYKIASNRGGADWNDVYDIIKQVFENSNVNVEIWKLDLG